MPSYVPLVFLLQVKQCLLWATSTMEEVSCFNSSIAQPIEVWGMKQVVKSLLSCLDDPQLPLLQWQECIAVHATRLPKEMKSQVLSHMSILITLLLDCSWWSPLGHSCSWHLDLVVHSLHNHLSMISVHVYLSAIYEQLEVKFREYESSFSSKGEALDFPAKALCGIMEVLSSLLQPLVMLAHQLTIFVTNCINTACRSHFEKRFVRLGDLK